MGGIEGDLDSFVERHVYARPGLRANRREFVMSCSKVSASVRSWTTVNEREAPSGSELHLHGTSPGPVTCSSGEVVGWGLGVRTSGDLALGGGLDFDGRKANPRQ